MENNDQQALELENILKEFSDPDPDMPEVQEETVSGDTIRLDQIQKVVASVPHHAEALQEEPEPPAPTEEAPQVEPFSEAWEPEYEAPMGDYTPPPITFRPKGRMQQLRAKLVAGPEKKYYELSETGFGKLQTGIFLNLAIFALAAGTTALHAMGVVGAQHQRLLVYVQILCMLLSGLVGCYRMLEGLADIGRLRFTLNTWLALAFVVCCVDGVLCLQQQRISCCAVFCLEMLMAQLAAYQKRSIRLQQMDTLRRASDLNAFVPVPEQFCGKTGFTTVPGEPEAFMDSYEELSAPEKVLNWYSLISLLVCGMFGLFGVLRDGLATGMQILAGGMLLSMPATAFISLTRPERLLSQRLHKLGVVLCGWKGVQAVPAGCVFPLHHEDVFPAGSIKLNGTKFLGERSPDLVVSYATSLICADGGGLEPLFRQLLAGRGGRVLAVEDLHRFDGGLSGVVDGLPVTLGTMEFMGRMGIELPKGTKVPQAVCLAVDGALAGMFAVNYSRSRSAAAGLRTLCSYRSICPVLAENDFMLTRDFLSRRFRANTGRLVLPEPQARTELQQKRPAEDAVPIALLSKEGLAPKAFTVTGSRMLRLTWRLGVILHLLGGILGLVIAAVLTWNGGQNLMTPENLLLYSLLWMVPGFLVTQWTRVL